jgi:exosortase E/protease (VPEID-CTERM system)
LAASRCLIDFFIGLLAHANIGLRPCGVALSIDLAGNPTCSRHRPQSTWRWKALVLLIVTEFLILSVRFDSGSIEKLDQAGATLIGFTPVVGQLLIALAVALVVFSGERLHGMLARLMAQAADKPFAQWPLWMHLVMFAVVFQLTGAVLEGSVIRGRLFWISIWICSVLTWFFCWFAAVLPIPFWRDLIWQSRSVLGIGATVSVAAVIAGRAVESLWEPLAYSTLWVVENILHVFYSDVVSQIEDLVVGTSRFSVVIAPSCSGYEGIGLILVFLSVFLWTFRRNFRFPAALALLPIAVVTIWATNALRIAALVAIGTSISPDIAAGGFHSQAGWLTFNIVSLGFVATAWRVSWFRSEQIESAASVANPTAPYLIPFLSLVATAMITGAISNGLDKLYALRVVTAGAALCYYARHYRQEGILSWTFSWISIAIGAAVFAIWMAAEPFFGAGSAAHQIMEKQLAGMSTAAVIAWLVCRAVGSVLIVPLVEELAFRGYLTRRLVNADFEKVSLGQFSWFGFLVSSIVFGLMHGRWLAGTVAGILFALAMYRRGRLTDAVVAHATANGLITIYVLTTGEWAVWS